MTEIEEFEEGINRRRRTKQQIHDLVATPEVARLLAMGMSKKAICESLGIGYNSLMTHIRTMDMADLMEIESRRVVRHIASRDLSKEKYLALVTGLGVMIDKVRLLRNEPTTIQGRQGASGVVNSITIALFGRGGTPSGEGSHPVIEINGREAAGSLPESLEPSAGSPPDGDNVGGGEG